MFGIHDFTLFLINGILLNLAVGSLFVFLGVRLATTR
jgi:hypothetical protein